MDLDRYLKNLQAAAAAHGLVPDPGPLADLDLPLVLSGQVQGRQVRLVPLPSAPDPEAWPATAAAIAERLSRAAPGAAGAPGAETASGAHRAETVVVACLFPDGAAPEDTTAVRQLSRSGSGWELVVWAVDLDLELVDRPPGSPPLPEPVLRALTSRPDRKEPRGPDPMFRASRGPLALFRQWARGDFGPVPVTRLLLATNVAFYLWTLLRDPAGGLWGLLGDPGTFLHGLLDGPSAAALVQWGANSTQRVLAAGEQWRLLTAAFLHAGLWHLALNMYALWGLGQHAELIYGSGPTAFIYFIAAVGGSLASVALRSRVISVGASGAIFGLLGALFYAQRALGRRVDWRDLAGPIGASLLWGLLVNVDNLGHFGGLAAGVLASWAVGTPGQRRPWRRAVTWALGLLAALLVAGVLPVPWVPLF